MVFFNHSVIQYAANVMKTRSPMTVAELQLPPCAQDGLLPASHLTYTATRVTLNHAPNAAAATPPRKDTRYICPKVFDTSTMV